ncbi:MAG: NAD(+) synthase, partial [Planctomycetales bacterium]|nr:NAD(+) synthase [Planctomycetales bacterium]
LAMGPRFSFQEFHVTSAVVDIDAVRVSRARASSFRNQMENSDRCIDLAIGVHELPDSLTTPSPLIEPAAVAHDVDDPEDLLARRTVDWEAGDNLKEEEFSRVMALGLYDYARKSHSRGFVVSLSGGADSAAVAVLCHLMGELAVGELGEQTVREQLSLTVASTERSLTADLLTCVYQATRNSSQTTRDAAAAVSKAIGATFLEIDVDEIVQSYVSQVGSAIGRELSWQQDDIALQNIQARTRGPSVWMLANIRGALLLATSNRSEAAVGYATMDGDTCGGLSPIAGIDKAFLRHWLRWMEDVGPRGVFSVPALSYINQQAPTAELRPQAANQTDEADLMPYELLDAIERAAIRDKKSPAECFQLMHEMFPQYTVEQLSVWVPRFFRLWCRNQWKRERYAPSFHLDDENLDPKTWCRFPILSGGYARELRELQSELARSQQAIEE